MALAILVKPTSIHLGLVFILILMWDGGWRALTRPAIVAFGVVSLLPGAVYYAHAVGIHVDYGNTFGVISGGDRKWGGFSWWFDPGFWKTLVYIDVAWIVGPAGALLGLFGLNAARKEPMGRLAIAWATTLVLYYCIVARYAGSEQAGLHYHIYAAPLLCLLAARGFAQARAKAPRALGRRWPRLVAIGLGLSVIGYQLAADVAILAKPRHNPWVGAGTALGRLSEAHDVVVVLSEISGGERGDRSFQRPDVFFHARRRGRVLANDRQSAEGLHETLADDARWFVNFPAHNYRAVPSFFPALEAAGTRVETGDEWEIWRIEPTAQ